MQHPCCRRDKVTNSSQIRQKNRNNNKNIIIKACAVITCKYFNESPSKKGLPGYAISNLIAVAKIAPDSPVTKEK